MTRARVGRKTRQEKLLSLQDALHKKKEQRKKIDDEIKGIESQIAELEHYFLVQETSKLNTLLSKQGLSIEDLTEAVEKGQIKLDQIDTPSDESPEE